MSNKLRVYNTLTGRKEVFESLHGNRVNMFVCGPTVYDSSHLGHARTYIAFDVIVRYLRYNGYSVFYLMNITDIDDKMIARANELGIPVHELADRYTREFMADMAALDMNCVNLYGKATEHVSEIVEQIKVLLAKGVAYEVGGYTYFEVNKFDEFGKLSGQRLDKLKAGARVEIDENKRNPEDFVLWKPEKPDEPSWVTALGKGRPGWHVEDTAISTTYFGERYDIHGGARDLIFPHHESEIAIAEAATGKKPFVKYWLHTGFLNVSGEKMSKSLGNFYTIRELLARYEPDVLRFFLIYTHYRSPIDFTETALEEARESLRRLKNTLADVEALARGREDDKSGKGDGGDPSVEKALYDKLDDIKERFLAAMDDDFNTREALTVMFELTREVNLLKNKIGQEALTAISSLYRELGDILGLFQRTGATATTDISEQLIGLLIKARAAAREKKDWATSDMIRDELKALGIHLEDKKDETLWKRGG